MIFSAIFFLTFINACKEEGELLPEYNTSGIIVSEMNIDVSSSTVEGDTVRTDRVSSMLLGKLYDNTYGLSTADYYTQFFLTTSSFTVPDGISGFDSLVLFLAYTGHYGFASDQEVTIYELNEALEGDI